MKDFIKQVLICIFLALIARFLYDFGIKNEFSNSAMYHLGIYMSLIILLFSKALRAVLLHLILMGKLLFCEPEDFGKILESMGIKARLSESEEQE